MARRNKQEKVEKKYYTINVDSFTYHAIAELKELKKYSSMGKCVENAVRCFSFRFSNNKFVQDYLNLVNMQLCCTHLTAEEYTANRFVNICSMYIDGANPFIVNDNIMTELVSVHQRLPFTAGEVKAIIKLISRASVRYLGDSTYREAINDFLDEERSVAKTIEQFEIERLSNKPEIRELLNAGSK